MVSDKDWKITLVQCKIHYNKFQPKGGGTILGSIQVFNVLSMKQEISSIEFSSLRTVKGTAEGFTKSILQEYVVISALSDRTLTQ